MKSSLTHHWAGAHRSPRAGIASHFTKERKDFIGPQPDKRSARFFFLPTLIFCPCRKWRRGRFFCPGCLRRCRPAGSALFCLGATMEPCCPCLVCCVLSGKKARDKAPTRRVRCCQAHTHTRCTAPSHLLPAARPAPAPSFQPSHLEDKKQLRKGIRKPLSWELI